MLAGSPDATGLRVDLSSTLRLLAAALQRARRPVEAIQAFEKALESYDTVTERSPGDRDRSLGRADLLNDLGRLLAEEHRPAEARRAFQKASETCEKLAAQIPKDPSIGREFQADCYFQWARALARLGWQRDAVETARKAVELYASLVAQRSDGPASQEVFYRWRLAVSSHLHGAALAATGSPREAAEAYRRAVILHPECALFNNDLAWFLVAVKDPPAHDPAEAVGLARKAVEIEPTAAHNWNTLGVALYRAGEYRAAIDALEKSEKLGHGREFGFNAFFLAMAHWQIGHKDKDEARRWYKKAVSWMEKSKPNDDELRRFLPRRPLCWACPSELRLPRRRCHALRRVEDQRPSWIGCPSPWKCGLIRCQKRMALGNPLSRLQQAFGACLRGSIRYSCALGRRLLARGSMRPKRSPTR